MEFKDSKGIFQQIADSLCERILSGEFKAGEKVPSIRDQATELGVNHNTIMRTYSELQRENIISNKRGIGYFVTEQASIKIIDKRKTEFFEHTLPEFIRQVELLKITKSDAGPLISKLEENENK